MLDKATGCAIALLLSLSSVLPASAQIGQFDVSSLNAGATSTGSLGAAGFVGRSTYNTGAGPQAMPVSTTGFTGKQSQYVMQRTGTAGLAPVFGMGGNYNSNPWLYPDWNITNSGVVPGGGNLASLQNTLPGSTFAQNHPRRTEVLENDSALLNQINSDYGQLNGQYPNLVNQANMIENQEEAYAAQNGGYITLSQQAQLNQEEAGLQNQINSASAGF